MYSDSGYGYKVLVKNGEKPTPKKNMYNRGLPSGSIKPSKNGVDLDSSIQSRPRETYGSMYGSMSRSSGSAIEKTDLMDDYVYYDNIGEVATWSTKSGTFKRLMFSIRGARIEDRFYTKSKPYDRGSSFFPVGIYSKNEAR